MQKGIKRDFAQDILAQGCSLVEWILVLEAMMQCTYEMTLQGSWMNSLRSENKGLGQL